MPKRSNIIDLTENKRSRMDEDDATTTGESNFDEDSIMEVEDNSKKLIDEIIDFHKKKRTDMDFNGLESLKFAFDSKDISTKAAINSIGFLGAKKDDWYIVYGNDNLLLPQQGVDADEFNIVKRGTIIQCIEETPIKWQDISNKKEYTLKANSDQYLIHLSPSLKEQIQKKKEYGELLTGLQGPQQAFDILDIADTLLNIQNPDVQEEQNAQLLNDISDFNVPLDDYIDIIRSSVPDDATRRTDKILESGNIGKIAEREYQEDNQNVFEFMQLVDQTPVNSQLTDFNEDDDETVANESRTIYDFWKVYSPIYRIKEVIKSSEELQKELDLEELENAFKNFTLSGDEVTNTDDLDDDLNNDDKDNKDNKDKYRNTIIQIGIYLKYIGKTVKYLLDKDTIKAGGIKTINALLSLLHFIVTTLFNGLMKMAADHDGRRILAVIIVPLIGYYHGINVFLYVLRSVKDGAIVFLRDLLTTLSEWLGTFDKEAFTQTAIEIISGVLIKSGLSDAFTQFAEAATTNSATTEMAVTAIQNSAEAMADTSAATMNLIMDLNKAEQTAVIGGVFSQLTGLAVEGVKQYYIGNGGTKTGKKRRSTRKNRKKNTKRAKKTNSRKKRTIKKARKQRR